MPMLCHSQVHILEVVCTPRQEERLQIFRQLHSPRRIGNYLQIVLACITLPAVMGRHDSTPGHLRHCRAGGERRHQVFECTAVQHIRDYHSGFSCARVR